VIGNGDAPVIPTTDEWMMAHPARPPEKINFLFAPLSNGAGALFFRGFFNMPLSPDAKALNTVSSQDIAFTHYI
jgi:hypothetical protein